MKNGYPRILMLRGGAIGDFIVTLPVLQALRERWPNAYIELLGYPHIARLAEVGGLADRVRSLDEAHMARFFVPRARLEPSLRDWVASFSLVFSFLHDLDGTVCENLRDAGADLVLYRSPLIGEAHAADHLASILEEIALYIRPAVPGLSLDEPTRRTGRDRLAAHGVKTPFAVLHAGSGSPKKNWPATRFLQVARTLQDQGHLSPVFILGEADEGPAAALAADDGDWTIMRDMALTECAGVLAEAGLYVGNDSGITHLAAAVGVPVLALFGPSRAATWAPRGRKVEVVQTPGESADMGSITAASVLEAVGRLLGGNQA